MDGILWKHLKSNNVVSSGQFKNIRSTFISTASWNVGNIFSRSINLALLGVVEPYRGLYYTTLQRIGYKLLQWFLYFKSFDSIQTSVYVVHFSDGTSHVIIIYPLGEHMRFSVAITGLWRIVHTEMLNWKLWNRERYWSFHVNICVDSR